MKKLAQWFDRTKVFLREVKLEMKKVTWPTKAQVKNYTVVVIVASFALAVVIGIWDSLLSYLLTHVAGIRG
jgi:preprotein translocase subunit SecE